MAEPQVRYKEDSPRNMVVSGLDEYNDTPLTDDDFAAGRSLNIPDPGQVFTIAFPDENRERTRPVDKRVPLGFLLNPYFEAANDEASDMLAKYQEGGFEALSEKTVVEKTPEEQAQEAENALRENATPDAVALADENSIEFRQIEATGAKGHIKSDVERAIAAIEESKEGEG